MYIVTLISDFGTKDHRSAVFKGSLLSACRDINIVDISHTISPFEIDEAAFVLRASYASFPNNTIHIVQVLNYYAVNSRIIFFKHDNQYFIGPDNGVFSLVFPDFQGNVYILNSSSESIHYTDTTREIVKQIVAGSELPDYAAPIEEMKKMLVLQPVTADNEIRGTVTFIDRYGNVTVNVSQDLFEKVRSKRQFSLFFNRHDQIQEISEHYMHVDIGTPMCRFNAQGYLEIAVNLQRADELLGIKKGDVIQIKFSE